MTDTQNGAATAKAANIALKMSRLVNARHALDLLTNYSLPASLSLRIARLARAANVEIRAFDRERDRLVKEFGETTDGQSYSFADEKKRAEYQKQMDALGNEEVTLPVVTITLKELGEREMPAALLTTLDWVFPEVTEEVPEEAPAEAPACD